MSAAPATRPSEGLFRACSCHGVHEVLCSHAYTPATRLESREINGEILLVLDPTPTFARRRLETALVTEAALRQSEVEVLTSVIGRCLDACAA